LDACILEFFASNSWPAIMMTMIEGISFLASDA